MKAALSFRWGVRGQGYRPGSPLTGGWRRRSVLRKLIIKSDVASGKGGMRGAFPPYKLWVY
jgi:hypothetical protein